LRTWYRRPPVQGIVASIRDDLGDDILGQAVRRAAVSCLWRHRQIKRHHATQTEALHPAAATLPLDVLRAHTASLATRAAGLTAEAGSEVRKNQENLAMQLGKLFTQDPARGEQRLHNIG
jgi:hypothetical protein